MDRPQIICLTPVKNEAWILERFLTCASIWADKIIVADQGSDDGSREIARRFPKVELIENEAKQFNEPERQKLLIDTARRIPGHKLLIALDADEFLTDDFASGRDRELVLSSHPGTVINFQWACVLPDRKSCYLWPRELSLGFMDDGADHTGQAIHSPRLPQPESSPRISLRATKVLHLSTIDYGRFSSKIRWYQCWEYLQHRWDGRLMELYRWYHKDFHVPEKERRQLRPDWMSNAMTNAGVLDVPTEPYYRWDRELLDMFINFGTRRFRRLALWDVDWPRLYFLIHGQPAPAALKDPRLPWDRVVQRWLQRSQKYHSHFASRPTAAVRIRDFGYRLLAIIAGY